MCDDWKSDFLVFKEWAMSNGYSAELTIDRIDNSLGYAPSNCRWSTQKVQQNNRSDNRLLDIDGETKTLAQWCEIYNIGHTTVLKRMKRGLGVKESFTRAFMKNQYG